jgi:hypothetical protein
MNCYEERIMYTHPATGMKYKEIGGEYFYCSRFLRRKKQHWIKSGMKRGFIAC